MPLKDARNQLLVAAHLLFPMLWAKATCSGSQVSKVVDLTFEQCTPNDRWTPEQFRQMKHPRFTEAQVGPLELQSAHLLFSSSFSKEPNSLRCASF